MGKRSRKNESTRKPDPIDETVEEFSGTVEGTTVPRNELEAADKPTKPAGERRTRPKETYRPFRKK